MIPTRRRRCAAMVLALPLSHTAFAQDTGAPPMPSTSPSPMASPAGTLARPKRPLTALPYTPSLDVTSTDRAVDAAPSSPCRPGASRLRTSASLPSRA